MWEEETSNEDKVVCQECGGTGYIMVELCDPEDNSNCHEVKQMCAACDGTGYEN